MAWLPGLYSRNRTPRVWAHKWVVRFFLFWAKCFSAGIGLPIPSFFLARIARRGERWMRNPGGKEFSREHWVCFLKGRRDRRPADKNRLKSACAREEPTPWSPKESPSPPGPGLPAKTGGGNWVLTGFFIFSSLMIRREGSGEFPALIYFPDRGYQKPSKPRKLADSIGESRRRPFFI